MQRRKQTLALHSCVEGQSASLLQACRHSPRAHPMLLSVRQRVPSSQSASHPQLLPAVGEADFPRQPAELVGRQAGGVPGVSTEHLRSALPQASPSVQPR